MTDPLYRRTVSTSGRVRYEPVGVTIADTFPVGAHLVVVEPGYRHTLYRIDPATADLLAAARPAFGAMLAAMRAANEPRPEVRDQERHRTAWAAYLAAGGEPVLRFSGVSLHDIIDAGIAALVEAAAAGRAP